MKRGHYTLAIAKLQQALDNEEYTEKSKIHCLIGESHFNTFIDKTPVERDDFYRATHITPILERNTQQALNSFATALECDSEFPDTYYHQGIALASLGDIKAAYTSAIKAAHRNPHFLSLVQQLFDEHSHLPFPKQLPTEGDPLSESPFQRALACYQFKQSRNFPIPPWVHKLAGTKLFCWYVGGDSDARVAALARSILR